MATRLTSVTCRRDAQSRSDREADRLAVRLGDEVGVAPVGERGEVPVGLPAADQFAIAFEALGRHDERDVGFAIRAAA